MNMHSTRGPKSVRNDAQSEQMGSYPGQGKQRKKSKNPRSNTFDYGTPPLTQRAIDKRQQQEYEKAAQNNERKQKQMERDVQKHGQRADQDRKKKEAVKRTTQTVVRPAPSKAAAKEKATGRSQGKEHETYGRGGKGGTDPNQRKTIVEERQASNKNVGQSSQGRQKAPSGKSAERKGRNAKASKHMPR